MTNKEKVLQIVATLQHNAEMADYSGYGETSEPECGDSMKIFIKVSPREIVDSATFTITEGACAPVTAAAELSCRLVVGKPVMCAYALSKQALIAEMADGEISIEHLHCVMMAELTMKKAVVNYANSKKEK